MITCRYIHHVSLSVTDLEAAIAFYKNVLCLSEMERPPFPFPGAWFAIGPNAEYHLHLIEKEGERPSDVTPKPRERHVAMRVQQSYDDTLAWLESQGVTCECRPNSIAGFKQIYVADPDGNTIELNFD